MTTFIGFVIVIASVLGGFAMEGGDFAVLNQPGEFIIIGGAAIGSVIASVPKKMLGVIIKHSLIAITSSDYSKTRYVDLLRMLYEAFAAMRKGGDMALEKDVEEPSKSPLFSKYPDFLANLAASNLLFDSLRLVIGGAADPEELDQLMEVELETHEDDSYQPIMIVTKTADALPGLGIVAAVLGIIVTMGHMDEGPQAIGQSVAAALVGTFLGIFACYGILQPIATKMEVLLQNELKYLKCIKTAILAHLHGAAPSISVEYARRVISSRERPSASELEDECRGMKTQEKKAA